MDDGVKGILSYLEETWESLLRVVEGADDRLIHWIPSPGFNSVAVLLRHLAGSERWWIGEAIGGIPSGRIRDAEFIPDRPERQEVLRSVEASRELSRRVLAKVSMVDLQAETAATVTVGSPPRRPTKLWALLHYLEHLGYHRGQILLLLKLARAGGMGS